MKKFVIILNLFLLTAFAAFSQDEQPGEEGGKIPERMRQYIQDRLNLSRKEADKFTPVFLRYFRDFVQTHREFKGDRLIFQQKVVELRLRYRGEFRQIMDEQRANKVYVYEDEFRRKAKEILETRKERLQNRDDKTGRRFRALNQ
ncbi:MAG: hypothetical protein EPN92_00760 [Chitinophagaceae bacterium]|nr:MAG: hypothetical protein EPN92_00760 [Chitinophagaceae bacterium]